MNETQRASLERFLKKEFPKFGIQVDVSPTDSRTFNIHGNVNMKMDDRHAVWKKATQYIADNFNKDIDWSVPYY